MQKKAQAYLADHPEIKTIYGTKDGFLFSERQNATAHSKTLKDKDVLEFHGTVGTEEKIQAPTQDAPFDYEGIDRELLEDREFLLARYKFLAEEEPEEMEITDLGEAVKSLEEMTFETE